MINLLPPQQKEELQQEENWKLVLILGVVILAFLISFVFILFSIKIFLSSQLEVQKIFLNQQKSQDPQLQKLEEEIINSNKIFSALNSFYQKEINLPEILEKIEKTLPATTTLTSFNFDHFSKEGYVAQISLSGYSPTREVLLEFKKNLENQKSFKEIYFQPEDWVTPTDINFSVNFKITD